MCISQLSLWTYSIGCKVYSAYLTLSTKSNCSIKKQEKSFRPLDIFRTCYSSHYSLNFKTFIVGPEFCWKSQRSEMKQKNKTQNMTSSYEAHVSFLFSFFLSFFSYLLTFGLNFKRKETFLLKICILCLSVSYVFPFLFVWFYFYLFVFICLSVCLTSSSPSILGIDFALLIRSNFSKRLALCSEVFCWGP